MKLFRAKIDPRCAYCKHSIPLTGADLGCIKRGVVEASGQCRRFSYDPFKRTPPKPVRLRKNYSDKDFAL